MAIQNNFPNIRPTLNLNFALSKRVDPRITFVRATTATYFDQDGVLQSAANNQGRITFDPSTLDCQGLLIEEQRTNSIRNNTMQGAVAGTPGTAPTNWSSFVGANLTFEIIGTGTESGITYIDLRIYGTANATNVVPAFEGDTQVVASNGQTWTSSLYFKIISQPAPFNSYTNRIRINNSGGSQIAQIDTGFSPTTTLTRYVNTGTIASATAAFVNQSVRLGLTSGQAYDVTFRIGLPQLELGAFATSVIPTTTTALTRNADVASMTGTNFSSWYNASEGTLYVEGVPIAPTSSFIRVASIDTAGAAGNVISIQRNSTDARGFGDGANTQIVAGMPQNAVFKTAFAGKVNDFALTSNGVTPNADTSTNALPTAAGLGIGSTIIGTSVFSGTIRRIAYYPTRLPDAQLQALTG